MAQFLVALALCYVLIKIPFWVLGSIRGGGGSLVGGLVRGLIAYKTFGLLGRGSGGKGTSSRSRSSGQESAVPPDPYARTRADSSGQYMLPLEGVKRGRLPKPPHQRYASRTKRTPAKPSAHAGKQQALFSTSGEPKNSALPPELHPGAVRHTTNPGEQTMLPIHARHDADHTGRRPLSEERPTTPPIAGQGQASLFTASGRARPEAKPPRPGQPGTLPVTVRPGEQHHLSLVGKFTGHPQPRTESSPPPEPRTTTSQAPGQQPLVRRDGQVHPGAKARPPRRARPAVPSAYTGIRPDRHGQYSLPGIPKPPPRCPPAGSEPAVPREPVRDPSQQALPLNLPEVNGGDQQ